MQGKLKKTPPILVDEGYYQSVFNTQTDIAPVCQTVCKLLPYTVEEPGVTFETTFTRSVYLQWITDDAHLKS